MSVSHLLTMTYGTRTILVPRPDSRKDALLVAGKHFTALRGLEVAFQTTQLAIAPGQNIELTDDVWTRVIHSISAVSIAILPQDKAPKYQATSPPESQPAPQGSSDRKGKVRIRIRPEGDRELSLHFTRGSSWRTVLEGYVKRRLEGRYCADDFKAFLDDREVPIVRNATLDTYLGPQQNSAVLRVVPSMKCGKPVIYVWSPRPQKVSVNLTLIRRWDFSALYPMAPITLCRDLVDAGQSTTWNVLTRDDGGLLDEATGLEVAYLFWEALTKSCHVSQGLESPPVSRPSTPSLESKAAVIFDPTKADLFDDDSVLLRVSDMMPYLDACLNALGLHTEARTSFITYWLPSFLRHEYVALRFIRQDSYSQAARMDVFPPPDVVVRVFMVFKGVSSDNVDAWPNARVRVEEDVGRWREVVGLTEQVVSQLQERSFLRVLEWGGMEVVPVK